MKTLIFLIFIFGLSFISFSQAFRDTSEIHFIKNILKNNHVKDWEEHLRYKQFWEMKKEFHIEDSLNEIRKNIHYPYEKKRSLYYYIYMKYFDIIPLSPPLEHDDYRYKG